MIMSSAITSIIISVITSVITVYFAFLRFKTEKKWELHNNAYREIMESLCNLVDASKYYLYDLRRYIYAEEIETERNKDIEAAMHCKYNPSLYVTKPNGLVRQYLKKGASFNEVDNSLLSAITSKLNHRPRKTLGYLTPHEIFYNHRSNNDG